MHVWICRPKNIQFSWLGTSHFLGKRDMQAVSSIMQSSDGVNNLGVYLHDSGLVMDRQVSKPCQVCYFHLRRLRTVRQSLTKESLRTLVHAFVTSRVDHCNSLLFGSHSYLLERLQSEFNSAARLILNIPNFGNISAAIRDELHWFPIRRKFNFKIPLWSDTAWLVLRRNTWWNCAILLAQPSVDNVSGQLN